MNLRSACITQLIQVDALAADAQEGPVDLRSEELSEAPLGANWS